MLLICYFFCYFSSPIVFLSNFQKVENSVNGSTRHSIGHSSYTLEVIPIDQCNVFYSEL